MAGLTMLTEHSPFMMGFVFVTEKDRAVVIDGGRPADMPYLFELIVFRVTAAGHKSVLFLGDLGPEGGRELLKTQKAKLPSDIVQMAHHGHSGVSEEVYRAISPSVCLWCAADWLYDEADVEFEPELWGTRHQRKWMDALGVKEHYVSGRGTQAIPLL